LSFVFSCDVLREVDGLDTQFDFHVRWK
jgi:hypothetical protein